MVGRDIAHDVPLAAALIVPPVSAFIFAFLRSLTPIGAPVTGAEIGVAGLGAMAVALPFLVGMSWHFRGGKAARAYVVTEVAVLLFASCFFHDTIVAFMALALPLAAPLILLALWEIVAHQDYVAARARALTLVSNACTVLAIMGLLVAMLGARIDVIPAAALALLVDAAIGLHLRRTRHKLVAQFDGWLDEVRRGEHESFAAVPATLVRVDLPVHSAAAPVAALHPPFGGLDDEWLLQDGEPILRVRA